MRSNFPDLPTFIASAPRLGDVPETLHNQKAVLEQELAAGLHAEREVEARRILQLLDERITVLSPLASTQGYGSVQIAKLDSGVLGMAPVSGSPSDIRLNVQHVAFATAAEIRGTLVHELRHTDQHALRNAETGTVFVVGGGSAGAETRVQDEIVLLEGDTETYVIAETGFDRGSERPPAVYGEGVDVAHKVRDVLQEDASQWDVTLTQTGNVEDLQNAVWTHEVRAGTLDEQTLASQMDATGYVAHDDLAAAMNERWKSEAEQGTLSHASLQEQEKRTGIDAAESTVRAVVAATRERFETGPQHAFNAAYAVAA